MRPAIVRILLGALALVLAGCATETTPTATSGAPTDAVAEVVDAGTAVDLLEGQGDLTIIDVRTPEEFDQGHLDGARLLDLEGGQFEAEVGDLDRGAAYLLYCRTGNRSATAAALMADLGFEEVYDAGGFDELAAAGAPTATTAAS